jgi:periplasmic copper chaperone A
MKSIIGRAAGLAGLASLALAAAAAAHITTDPAEAPSDGYATVSFQIPHGCEESPTTQFSVQIPPSVASATPAISPNWTIRTKEGKKDPVELHGEKITSGVSEVSYMAKIPLPADRLDFVYLSLKMPAGKPGESIYFPTVQKCEQGETRWIQIPAEGESEDDLESPAPAVVLTAADGEHGGAVAAGEELVAHMEQASADVDTAGASVDDDSAPEWVTIVALVLGALGLVAGVAGLTAARRRSA